MCLIVLSFRPTGEILSVGIERGLKIPRCTRNDKALLTVIKTIRQIILLFNLCAHFLQNWQILRFLTSHYLFGSCFALSHDNQVITVIMTGIILKTIVEHIKIPFAPTAVFSIMAIQIGMMEQSATVITTEQ
jgi:hypothetical protein